MNATRTSGRNIAKIQQVIVQTIYHLLGSVLQCTTFLHINLPASIETKKKISNLVTVVNDTTRKSDLFILFYNYLFFTLYIELSLLKVCSSYGVLCVTFVTVCYKGATSILKPFNEKGCYYLI